MMNAKGHVGGRRVGMRTCGCCRRGYDLLSLRTCCPCGQNLVAAGSGTVYRNDGQGDVEVEDCPDRVTLDARRLGQ
jgi:hypothetical protein